MSDNQSKICIRIDSDLAQRFKIITLQRDTSIQKVIKEFIEQYVKMFSS